MKRATAIRIQPGSEHVRLVLLDEKGQPFADALMLHKEALAVGGDLLDFSHPEDARGAPN